MFIFVVLTTMGITMSPTRENDRPIKAPSHLACWVDAMRPRTLPLALSSILTGSFLAIADGRYHWLTILCALVTGVLLQILSNLANDYGDALKGTDNEGRVGPSRAVQSGRIDVAHMRWGIIICSILSLLSGGALLYMALGDHIPLYLLFLGLGLAAIAAAIRYTIGAKAYGYRGFGDLTVFIFFGLVGVGGSWYLNTHHWEWLVLLPASAVGLLIAGVLNLNNMRDVDNDRISGKRTLAVLLGDRGARIYHLILILTPFFLTTWFVAARPHTGWNLLFLLALPVFVRDLIGIFRTEARRMLDPFLKRLSLSSLLFSVLFGVSLLL